MGRIMPSGQRVYIGNIPSNCRERDLERFFKGYGRLREVVVKNGYGFVEFDDYRDADDAVHDMDGKDMQGGRVRVELARDPRDRGGRGGEDDLVAEVEAEVDMTIDVLEEIHQVQEPTTDW